MTDSDIACALESLGWALADLYVYDRPLFHLGAGETAITAKLAHHLTNYVDPSWDVDAEYDREGQGLARKLRDPDERTHMRPDVVVHRRGYSGPANNLLLVEVKRRWASGEGDKDDCQKAQAAVQRIGYRAGVVLNLLATGEPGPRRNGQFQPTMVVYQLTEGASGRRRAERMQEQVQHVFDAAALNMLDKAADHYERSRAARLQALQGARTYG